MPAIHYRDKTIQFSQGETVLDVLLREGIDAAFSCRSGACQSCMMRMLEGTPPDGSQKGLKNSLVQKGYFLTCLAQPESDISIGPPVDDDTAVAGQIVAVERLSSTVSRVFIRLRGPFEYRPGQFINLVRADGLIRSYSLANLPGPDANLEIHVRKLPGGRMSSWLCGGSAAGAEVVVRGPAGDCFYLGETTENLLLVGTGTGLAPLYGIARDAIRSGHAGRIVLYHGALEADGLYLVEELRELARRQEQLTYVPCAIRSDQPDIEVGSMDKLVMSDHPDLANWRIYLCGDPNLVSDLRKKFFLGGASIRRIHADAFLTAAPPSN